MKKRFLFAIPILLILAIFLFGQTGNLVRLFDTNQTDVLTLTWNENDTSARTLNFLVNSGNRTIDLAGNLTIESTSLLNQDLTTDSTGVQFVTLGLGITPEATLHVRESGSTPTGGYDASTKLIVQDSSGGSDEASITIISNSAKASSVLFGDEDDSNIGAIVYAHDTDSLKFFTNAAQRTTIDSTGATTNPYQPGFSVQPTANQSDIAVGSDVTVIWGTERFDQNDDFASNTFTAPVTGIYHFDISLFLDQIDSASTTLALRIITSNKTYSVIYDPDKFSADLRWTFTFSLLADMDASDTAYVIIRQTGGAQQMDIDSVSWFSGHLVF